MTRLFRRLTGFKPARLKEWVRVVADEARRLGALEIVLTVGVTTLTLGTARSAWKAKLRACSRCPIYDKTQRKCRPFPGSPLGCGCYMPFKALSRGATCWIKDRLPDSKHGWGSKQGSGK